MSGDTVAVDSAVLAGEAARAAIGAAAVGVGFGAVRLVIVAAVGHAHARNLITCEAGAISVVLAALAESAPETEDTAIEIGFLIVLPVILAVVGDTGERDCVASSGRAVAVDEAFFSHHALRADSTAVHIRARRVHTVVHRGA